MKIAEYNSIIGVIPQEGLVGLLPAEPSFLYDSNQEHETCFYVTHLTLKNCINNASRTSDGYKFYHSSNAVDMKGHVKMKG